MNIIEVGDKLHIVNRRTFDREPRRHFVGEVGGFADGLVRLDGHAFYWNSSRNEFVRREERQERIYSLVDARNIVNVLPRSVNVDDIRYSSSDTRRLVMTDDAGFTLDLDDFAMAVQ